MCLVVLTAGNEVRLVDELLGLGTTELVDGLLVVPDEPESVSGHAAVGVGLQRLRVDSPGEEREQDVLGAVQVLGLIDEDDLEAALESGTGTFVVNQRAGGVDEQVVHVPGVPEVWLTSAALEPLVGGVGGGLWAERLDLPCGGSGGVPNLLG